MTRHGFDNAVRRGALVRLFPGVYVNEERLADPDTRLAAAVRYAGAAAALSHTTALSVWRLLDDAPPEIHLVVPPDRRLRAPSGIVVHRRAGWHSVVRRGLPVTRLEQALLDSWRVLPATERRRPVIRAVAERMTTPVRLRRAIVAVPNLAGRAELLALNHLLDTGCRSELEIWGYAEVFRCPGMPRFRWQHPVPVGGRTVYLDVYAETERVNFELDGAAWHASAGQRERDLRRDAALAAMGILVVRFTHGRLTRSPAEARREIQAILGSRR